MKKNTLSVVLRYFLSITLALLFYPMTTLGAQKHITVKGEAMTIKQAIQLIEKNSGASNITLQKIMAKLKMY